MSVLEKNLREENERLRARVKVLERVIATVQNASADSTYLYRDEAINRLSIIRAALLQGQEPLGAEFEAVWDANAAELYKETKP
jgi:hypothetical protein